jgi:hypothetical protein
MWGLKVEARQWWFEFTVLWSARREIMTVLCRAPPRSLSCLQQTPSIPLGFALPLVSSKPVTLWVCIWNLESHFSPWGGTFACIRMQQSWQLNLTIHHLVQSFTWHTETTHWPMLQEHPQHLNTHLLHIIPVRLSPLPPWQIVWPACNLRSLAHARTREEKHLSSCMLVYTNRSLFHGSVSCAFIHKCQVFSYWLHSFNSMFTADLYAMYRALQYILQP